MVYQELSLVPDLDVAENVYLHREPRRARLFLDTARLHTQCRAYLEELGIDIDPRARVSTLSVAQQQLVEIAKALSRDAEVVIFDEPTASLTSVEEDHLFGLIRRLRDRGTAIVYVSHRLDEIFAISDVVTVLKDGRLVRTMPAVDLDHHTLVSLMVGRDLVDELYPPRRPAPAQDGPPLLRVVDASSPGRIEDVSLEVWPGEIVGLAGLIGSGPDIPAAGHLRGRRERRAAAHRGWSGGRPLTAGGHRGGHRLRDRGPQVGRAGHRPHQPRQPRVARRCRHGGWRYNGAASRRIATEAAQGVRLDQAVLDQRSRALSGGNQQKVVVGKWLAVKPRVLLCDEPTRGIDVGTKAEIYRLLRGLADAGVGILLSSSELPEILGIADRVLVMRDGRLVAEFADRVPTEEQVMRAAAMDQMEVTA